MSGTLKHLERISNELPLFLNQLSSSVVIGALWLADSCKGHNQTVVDNMPFWRKLGYSEVCVYPYTGMSCSICLSDRRQRPFIHTHTFLLTSEQYISRSEESHMFDRILIAPDSINLIWLTVIEEDLTSSGLKCSEIKRRKHSICFSNALSSPLIKLTLFLYLFNRKWLWCSFA